MARKDVLRTQLLDNQSLAADFVGPATIVRYLDNCSYQINISTADSIGVFHVQASDDYEVNSLTGQVINAGNWIDLPLSGGSPIANAANDEILINLNQLPFNALRIRYTVGTAGTGTIDLWIVSKQIGG